jgi:hypothetical protein
MLWQVTQTKDKVFLHFDLCKKGAKTSLAIVALIMMSDIIIMGVEETIKIRHTDIMIIH